MKNENRYIHAREPQVGDRFTLPSGRRVIVDRALQARDCFSCVYPVGHGPRNCRDFASGVTFTGEFLMAHCKRED